MKTIGILGGMSWESSAVYYRLLNREIQTRLGGVHSAKLLLYSFDFDEMAWRRAEPLGGPGLVRGGSNRRLPWPWGCWC